MGMILAKPLFPSPSMLTLADIGGRLLIGSSRSRFEILPSSMSDLAIAWTPALS
jgi:hypothetical protein